MINLFSLLDFVGNSALICEHKELTTPCIVTKQSYAICHFNFVCLILKFNLNNTSALVTLWAGMKTAAQCCESFFTHGRSLRH
jgi:hypothetical protein